MMTLALIGVSCKSVSQRSPEQASSVSSEATLAYEQYLHALRAIDEAVSPGSDAWNAPGLELAPGRMAANESESPLTTLCAVDDLVVCRTDLALYALLRSKSGRLLVAAAKPLPADWIGEAGRGFSTYVDSPMLEAAFRKLVAARESAQPKEVIEALSSKSPLVARGVRLDDILYVDKAQEPLQLYAKSVHDSYDVRSFSFLSVDGRYALARINDRHTHVGPFNGSHPTFYFRDTDTVVVFRADNGKDWRVFSLFVLSVTTDVY
jgi:hypothetical protein